MNTTAWPARPDSVHPPPGGGEDRAVAARRRPLLLLFWLGLVLALAAVAPQFKSWWLPPADSPAAVAPRLTHYYQWLEPDSGPAGIYRLPVPPAVEAAADHLTPWRLTPSDPPHLALFTLAPISLNRADPDTLVTLPGIGPALAARIVEHRRQHGPFRDPDDLLQVHGIGPKTMERLRPLVEP